MKVAGYARVSTDLQREKETIKTQVELIEAYCAREGHTLVELYCDDGVSGTIALSERPGGAKLLADAKAGRFQGLVVYKADRIGRDVLVNENAARQLYDELGVQFIGVAESIDLSTPIGRAMFTFQSAIGRLERENTLQRSRDATLRLAKEGVWLGGIVPYGYRVEGRDREARLRISDELIEGLGLSEADVVRQMYKWSAEDGLSSIQIAENLNALGVPTVYARDGRETLRGKRKAKTREVWRGGRVRNMMVETTYKGLHVWGKRAKSKEKGQSPVLVERAVPAIVEEGIWEAAQVTLARNRLYRPDIQKRAFLLRGLMRCGHCGLTYVGTASEGSKTEGLSAAELEGVEVRRGVALRPYYTCNGRNSVHHLYGDKKARCKAPYLRAADLEERVWSSIEGFLKAPENVVEALREKLRERHTNAGEVESKLAELRGEIEKGNDGRAVLYRLFRKGTISESDLERQLAETEGEEMALAAQCERLERELGKARDAEGTLTGASRLLEKLRAKLESNDCWEVRRRIVETLVEDIVVQSTYDATAPRGQQRSATLLVTFAFEEATLERSGHRTAKTLIRPSSLTLEQRLEVLAKPVESRKTYDSVVGSVLENEPDLRLDEIIERVEKEHGVRLSRANTSRIRARLGRAPDTVQARAARAKFAKEPVGAEA